MCQLTYINVPHEINKAILYSQLVTNSSISHQDGTGFFQVGKPIFKSKDKPLEIKNFYDTIIQTIDSSSPIIAHVRLTTFKAKVSDENSHPFETDKLVLAHNGTLVPKSTTVFTTSYPATMIDSEIFLQELSKEYNGKNFVKAINTTMNKFTGPFAFLIYSKLENRYFAVKGATKTLYATSIYIDNEKVGYVINTERNDLVNCLNRVHIYSKLLCKYIMYLEDPVLLLSNSIFELKDKSYRIIGNIQENEPERPVVIPNRPANNTGIIPAGQTDRPKYKYQKIINFMLDSQLTLEEFDILFLKTLGIPLIDAKDTDFDTFTEYMLPAMTSNVSKRKAHVWMNIKVNSKMHMLDIYKVNKLKFPYFINKTATLERINRTFVAKSSIRSEE